MRTTLPCRKNIGNVAALIKTSGVHTATHALDAWRRQHAHAIASSVRESTAKRMHHSHLLRRSLLSLRGNVEACKFLRQCQAVLRMRQCMRTMHAWRAAVADSHMRLQFAMSLGDARKQRQEATALRQCLHGLRQWAVTQHRCRLILCRVRKHSCLCAYFCC